MIILNRPRTIQLLVSVFVVVASVTTAHASHSWNNYHWARTSNPLPLQVIDSVTGDWDANFVEAMDKWSISEVIDMAVVAADDSKNVRKRCQPSKGQMRTCNAAYGFTGWLGLATIGLDVNGHIDQGAVKINDSYSTYWTNEGEKNHVMCQEIGHVLGLDHTSEDGSSQQTCMDYSNDINSQWPNQHDYDELALIYAHLDSYDSFTSGGSGSGGGNGCNAPPGKGCNKNNATVPPMGVRVVSGANFEIWVAARADGGLWIHHVRLVPQN